MEQVIKSYGNNNDIGVLICLYTGIRIGELCALRWENINLDRKMMTINRTMYRVIDSYKFQYKKCHILSNKYTQHLSVFMEDV